MNATLYQVAQDAAITADLIPEKWSNLTTANAMLLKDEVRPGDYISMINRNNLAEVVIYRRTDFKSSAKTIAAWDGTTVDTSWYRDDADTYQITTADELAGLSKLVSDGCKFTNKTIKLESDINLNMKSWTPIGQNKSKDGVFCGTFDGCGHGIYNLMLTQETATMYENAGFAFFDYVEDAVIKNVNFENVHIVDRYGLPLGVAGVCRTADRVLFANITISGIISGETVASIAVRSIDSSYYSCINRAEIKGTMLTPLSEVVVGGFASYIKISKLLHEIVQGNLLVSFNNCIQTGKVSIALDHIVNKLVIGQLYGEMLASEDHDKILIKRCRGLDNVVMLSPDIQISEIEEKGFFAKIGNAGYGNNYMDLAEYKVDMLDGLIGRTPANIGISVVKATQSTVIDHILIPGSLNTLESAPEKKTFVTKQTHILEDRDAIENLSPYFQFIKNVST